MKRILIFLLAATLAAVWILPAGATVDPLDPTVAAVQRGLDAALGTETPGGAVVVFEEGEVLLSEGFGYADLHEMRPVAVDTAFELGELSTAFVAVVALRLAEEGSVSLDADIATYLPESFMDRLGLLYPVTLRQLLLGRAGFGGRIHDAYFAKESHCFESLGEALAADIPEQIAAPDTCTLYSAFGVALAAYALEHTTGESYAALAERYVFAPLGMTRTAFRLAGADKESAIGYVSRGEGHFTEGSQSSGISFSGLYPATGALSTARDMTAFIAWLMEDTGAPLLFADSKTELFAVVKSGVLSASALGFSAAGNAVGLTGNTLYHGASLWLSRREGRAVLVLTNTAENTLLALPRTLCANETVRAALPEGELYDIEIFEGVYALATEETRSFVGCFRVANGSYTAKANKDGTLQFLDMRLKQTAPGVFLLAEGEDATVKLEFLVDEEGEVVAVTTADGLSYQPVPFYLSYSVATVLLAVLMLFALWFFFSGVVGFLYWRHHREENGKRRSIQYVLPRVFAALQSFTVILQVLVGGYFGTAVFAPFYSSMAVLGLLFGIAATVSYVVAFLRSFFRRRLHHRIAYSAIFFVIFQVLIRLWALVPF